MLNPVNPPTEQPLLAEPQASAEDLIRFANIALIAIVGWVFNLLVYVALQLWHTAVIEFLVIVGTVIVRQWTLASGTASRLYFGSQVCLGFTFAGLLMVSLRNGQNDALAVWYLAALPMA